MSGIKVPFLRDVEIDDRAARCRRQLAPGLETDKAVDLQQVLENLDGAEVVLSDGARAKIAFGVKDNLPSNILGLTHFDKATATIHLDFSDESYAGMEHDGRERFTGAHEIGHVKLHLDELVQMTRIPHAELALTRTSHTHRLWCDSEVQANRFAAAFLAPDAGLEQLRRHGVLDVETVMAVFGMGRTAAHHRIRNFNDAMQQRAYAARRKGGR